ncbi:Uncharacterized protein OS=Singulisphaera acidiphila (strain ATCC BAA-1392 / DSM 18658 / VKM B-2454 / MOB10) GN=Sinac_1679 PE=4 SV=1 [Gemmataceae bacterium]|nr:Uncharacterized protein OS=Singulisphaera acidiphila (strain ATCC BAA-1392 / DSM 18658 / VKM B-2454 / MOB10) GN=Sinac_1679 PE=4 SV=1 [Gemmataceae bacterium]VTT99151.1 Uncharacterized protein OS=Singulisphaera acidiphila (strain ATCC BAA-1392 / DSM 18658 / VKM B-2454 / MOB10) GN=Sinac_1679 PE=4 SV=1 [Gemmataceae bacterium]
MQFVTLPKRHAGMHRLRAQWSRRSYFFDFDYDLVPDPPEEGLGLRLGPQLWRDLWPDVTTAVERAWREQREAGIRLCGLHLTIGFARIHDVDTDAEAIWRNIAWFVRELVRDHAKPIVPFPDAWFTGTVCALAEGIHVEGAFDRLPILGDALQDAGCDDPFVIDHLQMCPDHGSSCWVVEMIREQLRVKDRDGA